MLHASRLTAITLAALLMTLAGCGFSGSAFVATEERNLTAVHAAGSPVRVTTRNGAVQVVAESGRNDVSIVARVVAAGDSQEEAHQRLAAIEVRIERLADGSLDIAAVFPEPKRGRDGCSLDVRLPDAMGATVETSNGSITLADLGGDAVAQTSNGSANILRQGGGVNVRTSNGRIQVTDPAGLVDVQTSNGAAQVLGFRGEVHVHTSNGSVTCRARDDARGPVRIHTSNGSVTLDVPRSLGGRIAASTSNGPVRVNGSGVRGTGEGRSRTVHLADEGPASEIETSNGTVTVTVRESAPAAPEQ